MTLEESFAHSPILRASIRSFISNAKIASRRVQSLWARRIPGNTFYGYGRDTEFSIPPELADDNAEDLQVSLRPDDRVGPIRGPQHKAAFLSIQALHGEFVVYDRDDDVAHVGRSPLLHHDNVAGMNSGIDHGVALHLDQQRARRPAHQQISELLGTRPDVEGLSSRGREKALIDIYRTNLKARMPTVPGWPPRSAYVCVQDRTRDRTKYHLVYLTGHQLGIIEFMRIFATMLEETDWFEGDLQQALGRLIGAGEVSNLDMRRKRRSRFLHFENNERLQLVKGHA